MKKLLKSEICGSVNSARCVLIGWEEGEKSNFAATVHWTVHEQYRKSHKRVEKKKEEKHRRKRGFLAQSKHNLRTQNLT